MGNGLEQSTIIPIPGNQHVSSQNLWVRFVQWTALELRQGNNSLHHYTVGFHLRRCFWYVFGLQIPPHKVFGEDIYIYIYILLHSMEYMEYGTHSFKRLDYTYSYGKHTCHVQQLIAPVQNLRRDPVSHATSKHLPFLSSRSFVFVTKKNGLKWEGHVSYMLRKKAATE